MKLWYEQEAQEWVEALPVGNGRLGGMVFGGAGKERIQLNEDTLWSGFPKDISNYDAINHLDEVRKYIFNEEYVKAQEIIDKQMLGPWNQSYQPMGNLYLNFDNAGEISSYTRELDIENAVVTICYANAGVNYRREVFCSEPGQALVVNIKADKKGRISFATGLDSLLEYKTRFEKDVFILSGKCPSHVEPNYVEHENPVIYDEDENNRAMIFEVRMKVLSQNGNVKVTNGGIRVTEADEATLVVVAATSYNGFDKIPGKEGKNYSVVCSRQLEDICRNTYIEIKTAHINDYRKLYGRVDICLGGGYDAMPTDERLKLAKINGDDHGLAALYFQYGRYLLISSSRPGTQPANLQGIWNDMVRPPWSSNYTININTQMNYWPVDVCNLSECFEPLYRLIDEMGRVNELTARVHYNCRGWTANHNIDLWRYGTNVGGSARWAYWPMGGAWLCQHLWEHYCFTGDKEFLKEKAYPLMKGAALFCLDWLIEDKDGNLVTCPSISPENAFLTPQGESCNVSMASTMDMAIIWDLFTNCMEAEDILDCDKDFKKELMEAQAKLSPLQIGKYGQLQEWYLDFDEEEPGHRHISHLFGLHPGKQILLHEHNDLAGACKKTLERRLENGGGHTGWSCAWIISMFARLEDAENSYKYVKTLITRSTYPNMFDAHPPFQIDGNFGGAAGIAEMLLQSHAGEINILPALPMEWENGYVKGLRARGGFEVNIFWKSGILERAEIIPARGGVCRVRVKRGINITWNGLAVGTREISRDVIEFGCEAGKMYIIN